MESIKATDCPCKAQVQFPYGKSIIVDKFKFSEIHFLHPLRLLNFLAFDKSKIHNCSQNPSINGRTQKAQTMKNYTGTR